MEAAFILSAFHEHSIAQQDFLYQHDQMCVVRVVSHLRSISNPVKHKSNLIDA